VASEDSVQVVCGVRRARATLAGYIAWGSAYIDPSLLVMNTPTSRLPVSAKVSPFVYMDSMFIVQIYEIQQ
jgi:hypothetical protein